MTVVGYFFNGSKVYLISQPFYILGSGGHAREIAQRSLDILIPEQDNPVYDFMGFLNQEEEATNTCNNWVIGIGNPHIREKIYNKYISSNKKFINIGIEDRYHSLCLNNGGLYIASGVNLTTNVTLNDHVHLNTGCILCHDVTIDQFSTVSPGAVVCGNTTIGKRVWVGAGSTILEKLNICNDAYIGAGAVVTRDIKEPGIYVGVPAKRIK